MSQGASKDPHTLRALVRSAAERRAPVLARRVIDAWRVVNAAGDGAPAGLRIDRYGAWLVVSAREEVGEDVARAWAEAALEELGGDGLVLKILRRSVEDSTSAVFRGSLPSEAIVVREDDARFACDLDSGVSTGLFLDHHDTRALVRPFATGVEVLNLFAYTCAFSVHAAIAGAARVTSVDVAKRALARGRENMTLSGIDPNKHRWFDDDVVEHLARLRKRAPRYGLVIADPPVLGRARGRTFALERELDSVLEACLAATVPGGVLVFSTHAEEIGERRLLAAAEERGSALGRNVEVLHRLGLPAWDHPVLDAADEGNYLKTLVLRVG